MVDKLSKYSKIVLISLLALSVVFAVIGIFDGTSMDKEYEAAGRIQERYTYYGGAFMFFTYVLIGLTVVAILFSPIYGIIVDPKSIKKIGIILAIVAVIALIALLVANMLYKPLSQEFLDSMGITAGTDKLVNYFLSFTYLIAGGTIAAVIFSAVMKFIRLNKKD